MNGNCLSANSIVGAPMELDHIIPESLGGATQEEFLWLACSLYNDQKSDRITALDPRRARWYASSTRVTRFGSNTFNGPMREIASLT